MPAIAASMSTAVCDAHPTVAGSRAGRRCRARRLAPTWAAAGRELGVTRAVADAAPPAPQAVASSTAASPMKPCVEVFPAMIASRLTEDNRMFVEAHRIRGNEVGPDQKTSMISMATLLQEAASNHAVAMWGRSTEGFASDPSMSGLIFVMTRMQIQMEQYPRWGDVIKVETWFQEDGKLAAQRDWRVSDAATGQELGRATSTWVMINMQTRRLVKLPEPMRRKCEAFQQTPARHAIPRENTRQKLPELELPAEIVGPVQVARRTDMDMNGHVNNVTYLAWALETVPRDVYDGCHLYQMEVDFKAECKGGDLVESLAASCATHDKLASNGAGPNALSYVHVLRRCQGEHCTELVRMRTTWRVGEA